MSGSALDATTGAATTLGGEYYVIRGRGAIAGTPLPAATKSALTSAMGTAAAPENDTDLIVVPKSLSDRLVAAPPAAADARRPDFLCSDSDHTFSKYLTLDRSFTYSKSSDGKGLSGSATLDAFSSGYATVNVSYTEKQSWETACIPWIVVHDVAVTGNVSVDADASINATFSKSWSDSTQLLDPTLATVSIYGIPVTIALPITAGIDASAAATLTLNGSFLANSTFNVDCAGTSCSGSMNGEHLFSPNGAPTASVSARVKVTPWIKAAVQAYVISPSILSGQVGVKGSLQGNLFGYYGNTCGDANGDGTNETVGAVTLDAKLDVAVDASLSVVGSTVASHSWDVWNPHVGFWKIWDDGLLEPIFYSQGSVEGTAVMKGRMRPCWPYSDAMTYSLAWGDGTTQSITDPPATLFSESRGLGYGRHSLSLEAVSDAAGRQLGTTTDAGVYLSPLTGIGLGGVLVNKEF